METTLRGTDFVRVCITDRCLTIFGKCYNLQTGNEWDYFVSSENPEAEHKTKVLLTENLPFSHLQIALLGKRDTSKIGQDTESNMTFESSDEEQVDPEVL